MLLFPAMSMLSVGGILLILTNMQVSFGTPGAPRLALGTLVSWGGSLRQVGNLFGKYRSIVITLYNGAFDSSSAIFLIIKVGTGCCGRPGRGRGTATATGPAGTQLGTRPGR